MFKLDQVRTFKAKVSIPNPGQPKDAILEIEYKFKERDQILAYIDSMKPSEDGEQPRKDDEILDEIVCGWNGVDVEFSQEAFSRLLQNYPGAARAIWNKYVSEVSISKAKN